MIRNLKPGYLPQGAARLFREAEAEADDFAFGSPERAAIFDLVHARVRRAYPDYFRPECFRDGRDDDAGTWAAIPSSGGDACAS